MSSSSFHQEAYLTIKKAGYLFWFPASFYIIFPHFYIPIEYLTIFQLLQLCKSSSFHEFPQWKASCTTSLALLCIDTCSLHILAKTTYWLMIALFLLSCIIFTLTLMQMSFPSKNSTEKNLYFV